MRFFAASLLLLCAGLLGACATHFDPDAARDRVPLEELGFIQRAVEQQQGDLRIRAAVLSDQESLDGFGVPLGKQGIQPVWIEIANGADQHYVFLPIDVDPDYFAPFEIAWKYRFSSTDEALKEIGLHFDQYQLPFFVGPSETVSGFVFTNLDRGAKAVALDLIGEDHSFVSFEFVLEVPGLRADFLEKDWHALRAATQFQDLDAAGLRQALADLPCCVLGGDRETPGDPLNIVIIGQLEDAQILFPFVRRGWDLTETTHAASVWGTVKSSLFRSQYRYSPVSPLYLYDRPQDVALQKARASVDERNHLRLWMSPYRFRGMNVMVGQISRDIGVRFSSKTLVTHKIDPDVDEARDYLGQDLMKSEQLVGIGYVQGKSPVRPEAPEYNYTGDPYWTDGLLAVYVLANDRVPLSALEHFDWDWPTHRRRNRRTSAP